MKNWALEWSCSRRPGKYVVEVVCRSIWDDVIRTTTPMPLGYPSGYYESRLRALAQWVNGMLVAR